MDTVSTQPILCYSECHHLLHCCVLSDYKFPVTLTHLPKQCCICRTHNWVFCFIPQTLLMKSVVPWCNRCCVIWIVFKLSCRLCGMSLSMWGGNREWIRSINQCLCFSSESSWAQPNFLSFFLYFLSLLFTCSSGSSGLLHCFKTVFHCFDSINPTRDKHLENIYLLMSTWFIVAYYWLTLRIINISSLVVINIFIGFGLKVSFLKCYIDQVSMLIVWFSWIKFFFPECTKAEHADKSLLCLNETFWTFIILVLSFHLL